MNMKQLYISKKDAYLIILGVSILSLSIVWFLQPSGLVTGGISGLGIVVQEISLRTIAFGIPIWMTTILFNIPLFIISIKQRGFYFAKKSLYAVMFTSFSLWYISYLPNPFASVDDLLLNAIFGGIGVGIGIGIVLRSAATTGGTDMLASIIKYKHPKFPIPQLMLCIDGLIILAGLFMFGPTNAMYAVLSVFVTSKAISTVLEGGRHAKAAFIVSEYSDVIAKAIMEQIPRGSTGLKARGMYSQEEKEMLFTVVSQKEISKLREIIYTIDPNAFVTIADVKEVLGEGFIQEYSQLTF
ncbi:MAG: YitT family protein [Cellulosilyticaceae bacterium]